MKAGEIMKKIVAEEITKEPIVKYRYQCWGCTNDTGIYDQAKTGIQIICPICGKQQITKAENYIII